MIRKKLFWHPARLLLAPLLGLGLLSQSCAERTGPSEIPLLEPGKAFRLSTRVIDANTLEAHWAIADGYYMYRNRFKFEATGSTITLAPPVFPQGKEKEDPFFGTTEIYTKDVIVRLPIERREPGPHVTRMRITGQGCNEPIGVCYPPMVREVSFELPPLMTTSLSDTSVQIGRLTDLRDLIGGDSGGYEFLHPDQAFVLSVERATGNDLLARFLIADGYYLYREKTRFAMTTPDGQPAQAINLVSYELPQGKPKVDEYFGETAVYYGQAEVKLPLRPKADTNTRAILQATYQGCADKGICYPPITKRFSVRVESGAVTTVAAKDGASLPPSFGAVATGEMQAGVATDTSTQRLLLVILGAFGTGLLLTFTPCVLPMIPILSSVIIGQGENNISKTKGGVLSLTYVLGTAVTYTAIGIVAGATGDQMQAYFQNAWAIGILSAVFVAMALSMFGFYELQMPASIQSRLQTRTQVINGSSFVAVFILGLASALIVGACVSPLLISALGVAIASQDPVLGGVIMFFMALGMGVILIVIGVGAGSLLPKAGPWMERVRQVFGVLLLAVATYLLGFVPGVPVLFLWSALLIVVAVYLGATQSLPKGANGWRYLWKGVGTLLLIWGVLALLGGLAGSRDILRPLPISLFRQGIVLGDAPRPGTGQAAISGQLFERVTTLAALEERLGAARKIGKPVLLDYYADWCLDCLSMERMTFADTRVQRALRDRFILLQADVTDAFDPEIRAIKKRFGVYGPPATLFFAPNGDEIKDLRFYGFRFAEEFLEILRKASSSTVIASRERR